MLITADGIFEQLRLFVWYRVGGKIKEGRKGEGGGGGASLIIRNLDKQK